MNDLIARFAHISESTPTRHDEVLRFSWDRAEPLLVTVQFVTAVHSDGDSRVVPTWLVGRELLSNGGGDTSAASVLTVWRSTLWIGMSLRSDMVPGMFAIVYADAVELDLWLAETYRQVPVGDEVTEQHIDEFIARCGRVTP